MVLLILKFQIECNINLSGAHKKIRTKFAREQKQSFFNCLLDMAAMEKSSSRAGSINIDNTHDGNANSQTHLLHGQNGQDERSSLSQLARHSTIRKRSLR